MHNIQVDAIQVLKDTISQLNIISNLKITRGFAVSAKTEDGIKELKQELLKMAPARSVPVSYEKLLNELRSQSAKSKLPFLMAKDVEKLALTDKVRVSLETADLHTARSDP